LGLFGEHPRYKRCIDTLINLANHDVPLLIAGEAGTGKRRFARLVHRLSARPQARFDTVYCGALPEAVAESLLLGSEAGALPGSARAQRGRFRSADGGTLYLRDVDLLSLPAQAGLLELIETGAVTPVGGTEPQPVGVRIIVSTTTNLLQQVARGLFREDLFYRLRAGEVRVPSLRERSSDISALALEYLRRINYGLGQERHFSHEALRSLSRQEYPGNLVDLRTLVERAALFASDDTIHPRDLFLQENSAASGEFVRDMPVLEEGFKLENYLGRVRRHLFQKAVHQANGNQSLAARLLGVTPQAVHNFLRSQRNQANAE
jgi:DNA-binding NtrC family response regulator